MVRIFFDTTGFKNIHLVNIYGSTKIDGTYDLIVAVDYKPNLYFVELDPVTYPTALSNFFFKVSLTITNETDVALPDTETDLSDPVVSEDFAKIIASVSSSLGDLNRADPAFTDEEYVIKIVTAIALFKGNEAAILRSADYDILAKYVMKSCCYDLAYNAAKYTKITLPDGISINKGERVAHYLAIIKAIQDELDDILGNPGIDSGDGIRVIDSTRKTYFNRGRF